MTKKRIETLIEDIYKLFESKRQISKENVESFSKKLADKINSRMEEEEGENSLRLSNIGTNCNRKLWYSINKPELAEKLRPEVKIKFLYGDILEELLLLLAKEAGHDVRGEQDEVEINGVRGHRDAVIDGRLVDVKSSSSIAFKKFKEHTIHSNDSFGYMDQLNAYRFASDDIESDLVSFFVIDKQLGHITLTTYRRNNKDYNKLVEEKKEIIKREEPPERGFSDEPEGKSGNRKLGVECGYCQWKHTCWPGVRTFLYSRGPVYLTKVVRQPDVVEATRRVGSTAAEMKNG